MKRRWHTSPPLCPTQDFVSALRNPAQHGGNQSWIKGLPIYDDVRSRAYEDGLSMHDLDCELRTGKYFQDNHRKILNWEKFARAVAFFGGQMTVDWKDV
jgi:hypothetical protein